MKNACPVHPPWHLMQTIHNTAIPPLSTTLLLLGHRLVLRNTPDGLGAVLALLALLPARPLDLRRLPVPHQSVVRLKLLHGLAGVVDEGETGALAATVLSAETESRDLVLVGLVEFGELGAELVLGDVGAVGVEDVNDHLLAAQE